MVISVRFRFINIAQPPSSPSRNGRFRCVVNCMVAPMMWHRFPGPLLRKNAPLADASLADAVPQRPMTPLPQDIPQTPTLAQRIAYLLAGLLVLSGLVHTAIWFAEGGAWEGAVSWRKPILFGVSAGATVFSIGWVVGKLKQRVGDSILLALFAIGMFVEVLLITAQVWRGVPSHFNRSTPVDALILTGIEGLILFATVVICYFTIRCVGPMESTRDMRLAIRGGMLLLVFACLFGLFMVWYGNGRVAEGHAPGIYGQNGVMKFPHGMPIHAIQYLPLLAWWLNIRKVTETGRVRCIALALASLTAFTGFSLCQTFGGRSRFDLTPFSGTVLLISVALLLPIGFRMATGGPIDRRS